MGPMSQQLKEFYLEVLTPQMAPEQELQRFTERVHAGRLTRDENALSHVCVMIVVFDPLTKTILVVNHKKAGTWIFPGGHVDGNELPDATALREAEEELGLKAAPQDLIGPFSVQVLDINRPPQVCREHYDMFYAMAAGSSAVSVNMEEFLGFEWLDAEEARQRISSRSYRDVLEKFLTSMDWQDSKG